MIVSSKVVDSYNPSRNEQLTNDHHTRPNTIERPLYGSNNLRLERVTIGEGESGLKESRHVEVHDCAFEGMLVIGYWLLAMGDGLAERVREWRKIAEKISFCDFSCKCQKNVVPLRRKSLRKKS